MRNYEEFALDDLKLQQVTIDNQKSTIQSFLNHSKGLINKQTVKSYLQTNESASWKTNQVKALRKYLRDFLKLGRWIEEFGFTKARTKLKEIPSDEQLAQFCVLLPYQTQIISPAADNPLFSYPQVVATPHLGASTGEAQLNVAIAVAEQVRDYLTHGMIGSAVNVPSISADDAGLLSPYVRLGERIGSLHAQLSGRAPQAIQIEFHGEVAAIDGPADGGVIKIRCGILGGGPERGHEEVGDGSAGNDDDRAAELPEEGAASAASR